MNALSLFSGIGGLDLGLERAGMTVVGQVEIDPWCRQILAKHWPEVPRHDDVRTCTRWWGHRTVDLVAAGVPCQPVSVAGLRLGSADPRWLWTPTFNVISSVKPKLVLVENSPRLRTAGLREILVDLARLGFDAWWNRVPAAAVGAPHLRWRLFLIAAHPDRIRLRDEPGGQCGSHGTASTVTGFDGATWALADPDSHARESRRPGDRSESTRGRNPDRGTVSALPRAWATEPGLGRVADGTADRVDRLCGIGNAVVPQVAEHIGRLIMEASAA